jgi:hypothetical protein
MTNDGTPNADQPAGDGGEPVGWRETQLQHLIADIAARLRAPCAHLSDEEFTKLVLEMAERRMRFDTMNPIDWRPPRVDR